MLSGCNDETRRRHGPGTSALILVLVSSSRASPSSTSSRVLDRPVVVIGTVPRHGEALTCPVIIVVGALPRMSGTNLCHRRLLCEFEWVSVKGVVWGAHLPSTSRLHFSSTSLSPFCR